MSDYWVCSDNIDGKENSRIDALVDALKKNGHTAHNGGVGPNTVQSHGQTSSAKGQIGVFICGGVDIQVFWDFVQGIGSYYNYKRFIYVYASDTATTDKWLTCNGAKNTPTVQAHDDNYSGGRGDAIGKTVDAYCNEHKDKIWYACGPLGCTFNDVIQNFLNGEGAGDGDANTDSSSSSSSIKEAITDVLWNWDGEAECYLEDDTVHIRKIPAPSKSKLKLIEGVNIDSDSVNLTDVNPSTVNHLTCDFQDLILTIQDEYLIKRFGEISSTVKIDSDIKELDDAKEFLEREWCKIKRDNGRQLECKVKGNAYWKVGRWCRVYLPSFNIDDYMFITKCSHDDSGEWDCNLALVDYPPSFGEPSNSDEESSENTDTESSDTSEEIT